MRAAVLSLGLTLVGLCSSSLAADAPADLAKIAGEWQAESSVRTGQAPAPAESLAKLSLKIEKDQWIQSFGKDTASYTITLDPERGTMRMAHNKVAVVLNTTYVLDGDKLIVTRVIGGESTDTEVKVWRRKGKRE